MILFFFLSFFFSSLFLSSLFSFCSFLCFFFFCFLSVLLFFIYCSCSLLICPWFCFSWSSLSLLLCLFYISFSVFVSVYLIFLFYCISFLFVLICYSNFSLFSLLFLYIVTILFKSFTFSFNRLNVLFTSWHNRMYSSTATVNYRSMVNYHQSLVFDWWLFQEIFFIIIFRSNCMQILVKTGVIGNFAIFTGKYLYWSLILIKLQRPATLFQTRTKRDFNTDDSCENCKIFTNSFFYGTPPVTAFLSLIK